LDLRIWLCLGDRLGTRFIPFSGQQNRQHWKVANAANESSLPGEN
jgi:hypothetical protein